MPPRRMCAGDDGAGRRGCGHSKRSCPRPWCGAGPAVRREACRRRLPRTTSATSVTTSAARLETIKTTISSEKVIDTRCIAPS